MLSEMMRLRLPFDGSKSLTGWNLVNFRLVQGLLCDIVCRDVKQSDKGYLKGAKE